MSAIVAGGMRTPFLLDRFPDIDEDTLQPPENVAAAVRYLLTADYVTGTELVVDGGRLAG